MALLQEKHPVHAELLEWSIIENAIEEVHPCIDGESIHKAMLSTKVGAGSSYMLYSDTYFFLKSSRNQTIFTGTVSTLHHKSCY